MKAILILNNMPENCTECILANEDYDVCQATQKSISYNERGYSCECPLKPLKENYISIHWLKQSIPFQHEEDQTILLSMLESWSKHE